MKKLLLSLLFLCPGAMQGADPKGTVVATLFNSGNGRTMIENAIYLDEDNNMFGAAFVSAGIVSNLDDIVFVPKKGWRTSIPAKPGRGVVADIDGMYCRIYVESEITSGGKVVGVNVRYQTPFFGEFTSLTAVSTHMAAFSVEGGSKTIYVKSPNNQDFDLKLPALSYYNVKKGSVKNMGRWTHYVEIESAPNDERRNFDETLSIVFRDGTVEQVKLVTHGGTSARSATASSSKKHTAAASSNIVETGPQASNGNCITLYTVAHKLDAACDADWCKIMNTDTDNASNRGLIYYGIEENTSGEDRTATLSIKGNDGSDTAFYVVQKAYTLKLQENGRGIDRTRQIFTVELETPAYEWDTFCETSWISYSWSGKTMTVKVDDNWQGKEIRYGQIHIRTADGNSVKYSIAQSPYAPGDYFERGSDKGVIVQAGGSKVKIMSLDEGRKLPWATADNVINTSREDGRVNSDAVKSRPEYGMRYPAFGWAESKNTAYSQGWYLPSEYELLAIMENYHKINKTLRDRNATPMADNIRYWSSTEATQPDAAAAAYARASKSPRSEVVEKLSKKCYIRAIKKVDLEY